ncbi:conserved exported protein of unknown function [Methylacidimicrobium sp. AP8]|uniref:hypothetical protein n=1 Tax=Methylacidimicrobium sp. AP8 TaxID=2730359 RepID=UPI0018C06DA5|nr:hypothetical protein [Methylacidimicrobium sp. AP8]CAB4244102.1 conserved exported protein of unknown function [Methylacidimicrobium sp. AP8]
MNRLSGWKGWTALLVFVCLLAAAGNWAATAWRNAAERKAIVTGFQTRVARALPQVDALRSELTQQKHLLEKLLAQGEAATESQGIPTDLLQTAAARFRELLDRASALANQIQAEADQAAAQLGLPSSDSLFPSSAAPSWRAFLTEINEDRQWDEATRQRIALLEERWTMLAAREHAAAQQPGYSPEDLAAPPPDVPATNPPVGGYGGGGGGDSFVGDTEAKTTYGGYGGYPYWGMGMWGWGWWGIGLWWPFLGLLAVFPSDHRAAADHEATTGASGPAPGGGATLPGSHFPPAHHGLAQHGIDRDPRAGSVPPGRGPAHTPGPLHPEAHGAHGAAAVAHGGSGFQSAVHPQHLFSPGIHDVAGHPVTAASLHGANLGSAAYAHGFRSGGPGAGFAGHTGLPPAPTGGFHGAAGLPRGGVFHGASGLGHGGTFHGAAGLAHGGLFHGATGLSHGGMFHGVGGSAHLFHGATIGPGGMHGVGGFHGMPGGFHGGMGGFHGGFGGFGGFHGGGGHR